MSSAHRRSTALSAANVSAGKKKASRGERRGGEGESGRVGEGEIGRLGDWANLPSSFFLLPSFFFLLPSSFFLLPSSFFLLPSKIVKALTRLSISVSVFPKLIINVRC